MFLSKYLQGLRVFFCTSSFEERLREARYEKFSLLGKPSGPTVMRQLNLNNLLDEVIQLRHTIAKKALITQQMPLVQANQFVLLTKAFTLHITF